MGTAFSITVVGSSHKDLDVVLRDAEQQIQSWGRDWYAWNPDGELGRLNAALKQGEAFAVNTQLADLLERARELHARSDGTFDPAIAPMVENWGFHSEALETVAMPTANGLANWMNRRPTLQDLVIDLSTAPAMASSKRRDLRIDLGAIGKGRAVDLTIDHLRRQGITRALVNAGGNLRAIGQTAEGNAPRPWRIAIKHSRNAEALGSVTLGNDESVSTSGDYERFAIIAGRRAHHLLDPTTGRPAEHTSAVTVFAKDATLADAASTAIFIAGPARWPAIAQQMGISEVLRIDASGAVQVSRALYSRLRVSQLTVKVTIVDL